MQVCTTLASSSTSHRTKAFNMPNVLADYVSVNGQTHFVGVKSTCLAIIQVKASLDLPWGDHYDITAFRQGMRQQLVADEAASLYKNPDLSNIGGFFYTLFRERDRVRSLDPSSICLLDMLYFSWSSIFG